MNLIDRMAALLEDKKAKKKESGSGSGSARMSKSSHYPFKRKSLLGPRTLHRLRPPAPPPRKTRLHSRRNRWSCNKIAAYRQLCTGIAKDNKGQKLRIRIHQDYKKQYNKTFKHGRTLARAAARRQGRKSDV